MVQASGGQQLEVVLSVNEVPIRFPMERWFHIVENHDDLAGYYDDVLYCVNKPDFIIKGYRGALIAKRKMGRRRYLAVVYKELGGKDGFIISAYFTSKSKKENKIWP